MDKIMDFGRTLALIVALVFFALAILERVLFGLAVSPGFFHGWRDILPRWGEYALLFAVVFQLDAIRRKIHS